MRRMEGNESKPNCLLLLFFIILYLIALNSFFVVLCVASQQRASHKYTITLTNARALRPLDRFIRNQPARWWIRGHRGSARVYVAPHEDYCTRFVFKQVHVKSNGANIDVYDMPAQRAARGIIRHSMYKVFVTFKVGRGNCYKPPEVEKSCPVSAVPELPPSAVDRPLPPLSLGLIAHREGRTEN